MTHSVRHDAVQLSNCDQFSFLPPSGRWSDRPVHRKRHQRRRQRAQPPHRTTRRRSLRGTSTVINPLQSGAATCPEGLVICFIFSESSPCSVEQHGTYSTAQQRGNSQKTLYKTFGTSCRPSLYLMLRFSYLKKLPYYAFIQIFPANFFLKK